jgi:iron(III) transport system permease protein
MTAAALPGLPRRAAAVPSERAVLLLLVAFVGLVSVLPMARLLAEAVAPRGDLGLHVVARVLDSPATWRATWNTLTVASLGTLVSVAIGGAFAVVVALTDVRRKTAIVFGFMLPLMIPPQIVAISWIQLAGPGSALMNMVGLAPPPGSPNPLYSPGGIVLLMGIEHSALVFLALRAGLRSIPAELVEAARASGAGPWRVFATVVLPLAGPSLIAGTALAFVSAVGNFGIPALLGIPAGYPVLTTLIYRRLAGFGTTVLAEVAVLSVLIALIAFAGVALQAWLMNRADARTVGSPGRALEIPLGRWRGPAEAALWAAIALILVLPFLSLLATALVPAFGIRLTAETATLANFAQVLFSHPATTRAFRNSILMASAAAVLLVGLSVLIGYFLVWRRSLLARVLDAMADLPYAVPGVVLSIAMILVFIRPLPVLGVTIYNTLWIILLAYLARFLALALRPTVAGYHALDRALEEAARTCGAGLWRRLTTVVLPLVAPIAAAGGILVFLTALNELTVSVLLWTTGLETLGVVVYNLEEGGNTVLASAVSVVAVGVIVALMALSTLAARRLPRGVLPWQG